MKALVTGGAGFIGSHLVELLLKEKHEVLVIDNLKTGNLNNLHHVIDHPEFTFYEHDITNKIGLSEIFKGVDWVFHLAALAAVLPSIENPEKYFESNVTGTMNVLEASRAQGIKKCIYSASCSCYGNSSSLAASETSPLVCHSPYALMKLFGEELALHWERIYGLKAISLRLFNVYGPRSGKGPYASVINTFMQQKKMGQPLTIVGDGLQTRDFIYVTDVVHAFYLAAQSSLSGEIFNVGSSKSVTINQLAEIFKQKSVYLPKREGELEHSLADITKIQTMLGWKPTISLEEGIRKILEYQNVLA